jgi:sialate O-acetylesterase
MILLGGGLMLPAHAGIKLAPLFRDGAVLQRDKPIPVWGTAAPGEKIRVSFGGRTEGTIAGADGRWMIHLPAQPASSSPAALTVTGDQTVRISDVLVGDVWVCAGQSNMELSVRANQTSADVMAGAKFPLIRQIKFPRTPAAQPAADISGAWTACSPETVGTFSAAGFFFAREIQRVTGVPIGLVNNSHGGSPVEAWMSEAALKSDPAFEAAFARWREVEAAYPKRKADAEVAIGRWEKEAAAAKAQGKDFTRRKPALPSPWGSGNLYRPSALYHGMLHPLLPYAIRGILWYQGEANAERHEEYARLFSAMITQWRRDFGQGDVPFYFVQLASYRKNPTADPTGRQWALMRQAQAEALKLPNTGMVVNFDNTDPSDLHPKNKQTVGERLAALALVCTYGTKDREHSGPVPDAIRTDGNALCVDFSHAQGLHTAGRPATAFELAGRDGKFVPATARIEGHTIIVKAENLEHPVALRYAWRNVSEPCLFNREGFPAAPFQAGLPSPKTSN